MNKDGTLLALMFSIAALLSNSISNAVETSGSTTRLCIHNLWRFPTFTYFQAGFVHFSDKSPMSRNRDRTDLLQPPLKWSRAALKGSSWNKHAQKFYGKQISCFVAIIEE